MKRQCDLWVVEVEQTEVRKTLDEYLNTYERTSLLCAIPSPRTFMDVLRGCQRVTLYFATARAEAPEIKFALNGLPETLSNIREMMAKLQQLDPRLGDDQQ